MNSYKKYLEKVGEASKTVSILILVNFASKYQKAYGVNQSKLNKVSPRNE